MWPAGRAAQLPASGGSPRERRASTSESNHTSELLQLKTCSVMTERFSGSPRSSPEIKAVNNCSSGMINGCRFSFISILITICTFWQLWTQRVWWRLQKQLAEVIHGTQLAVKSNTRVSAPAPGCPATAWSRCVVAVGVEQPMHRGWLPCPWTLSSPRQLRSPARALKAPLQKQPLSSFRGCDWPLHSELLWQPFVPVLGEESDKSPPLGLSERAGPPASEKTPSWKKSAVGVSWTLLISQLKSYWNHLCHCFVFPHVKLQVVTNTIW